MWNFLSPKIVFGEDSVEFLERLQGRKVVLISDEIVGEKFSKILERYVDFAGRIYLPAREPYREDAEDVAEKLRETEPDFIVALGGGSVLDVAKAARILAELDIPPEEITPFTDLGEMGYSGKVKLVAIPTTSGTGSEVTWAIVLKDRGERRKIVMANEKAMPDVALVDPIFVYEMPESIAILSGFDALSHAVEAYLSAFSNPFSDSLAVRAVRLIAESFEQSAEGDRKARENMHLAATIAGLAFSNSQVGVVHALAHATGAVLNMPHGIAVAVYLKPVLEYYAERGIERVNGLSHEAGMDVMAMMHKLYSRFGVKSYYDSSEIRKNSEGIVKRAMEDSCIVTGPFVPDEDELFEIIGKVVG
ncbi:iron-containing alcohol dehydrogenase [Geoglobus acetivorans]|uniref:Alcohol dehydrogenase n=1 Tax=Geoglobus acetivorans TaxID=565033 RepID=A0A0A7GE33_GEOAI|nr:Alcohol dehydrogenase [Geoglobus acetivorans]